MSLYSYKVDNLMNDLGGCGLLQKLLCVITHVAIILAAWSVLGMAFFGYDPGFTCRILNIEATAMSFINASTISTHRLCSVGTYSTCSSYQFSPKMNTIVSEWNLVCDKRWVVAVVTSVQMAGVFVGNIVTGPLADSIGRKPSLIINVLLLVVFNSIAYFIQTWEVYAVIRFLIGIGAGIYFTVSFPLMIEFVPSNLRPIAVCFPSEPIAAMLFAFVSFWLHDWRSIHLLKTLIGIPILMTLCFIPESFRWLISKLKFERADETISFVANVNGVIKPDIEDLFEAAQKEIAATSAENISPFSLTILWSNKDLRKVTMSLTIPWFAICCSWFCMALGMESFSVNIYLTIFLINLVDLPSVSITAPLVNRYGRKKYLVFVSLASGILSVISGILQYYDKLSQHSITLTTISLIVSLLAKMTLTTAYYALIIYTNELYPTVVRGNGYGLLSTIGRVGSIVSPVLIYLDGLLPGIMYFICGVMVFLSTCCVRRLQETKDMILLDSFSHQKNDDNCK